MAILRVPRITTAQREGLVLLDGEIVFDTDIQKFFGGDGSTAGGIAVGAGVPTGGDTGSILAKASTANYDTEWIDLESIKITHRRQVVTLSNSDITQKKFTLHHAPIFPETIQFIPDGGIHQRYDEDFTVTGSDISWNGLGLEGFLEAGDKIRVIYTSE